jgi:hypothetical protein
MRSGFIIVEWMMQFLLCALIGIVSFSLFRTWSVRLGMLHKGLHLSLQMPTASDALRRDLSDSAPDAVKIFPDKCVYVSSDKYIAWQIKKNKLFRIQKNYDSAQKKWRKATKNLAAELVGNSSFRAISSSAIKDGVAGVQILDEKGTCLSTVALRNGKTV